MSQRLKIYQLSRLAKADLESIYDYTLENWSRRQADKYYSEFVTSFKALAAGRKIGRGSELGQGILKILVGSHIVFYFENNESIDIIRILHQAMDITSRIER